MKWDILHITKLLKIGLVNSNDIDKLIKYFSGSGDIIFSNET